MKKQNTNNQSLLGKVPPQDIETEKALLGTVINYPQHLVLVEDLFKERIFYHEQNRLVCEAILTLKQTNRHIDEMTVCNELRKSDNLELAGGFYYVTLLSQASKAPASIPEHVKILHEHYVARSMIKFGTEMVQRAYSGQEDPFELLSFVINQLDEVTKASNTKTEVHIAELSLRAIREREASKGKSRDIGLSTGLLELDSVIGGLEGGQFVIIAARPAMGKTAVAIALSRHIAQTLKVPTAIFELEMRDQQLYIRLQGQESKIDTWKIKKNELSKEEAEILYEADANLSNIPLYIDDTAALNISQFRAKLTIMKHKYGIGAAVIDYIQLMRPSKNHYSPDAEITEISQSIKQIAKDLNIPIIGLSQLSRDVEKRPGQGMIPRLSDLRSSGSLEQDADMVIFLHRPEYYKITEPFTYKGQMFDPKDLLLLIIAKQREGETKTVPAMIKLSTMELIDHPNLHGGNYVMPF